MFHALVRYISITHQSSTSLVITEPTLAQPCHLTSRVYKDLNLYILWIWTMHKICIHLFSIIQSSFTALKSPWVLHIFFLTFRLLTLDIMDSSCSTFLTMRAFPNGCCAHASLCLRFLTHQQARTLLRFVTISFVLALILGFHHCAWPLVGLPQAELPCDLAPGVLVMWCEGLWWLDKIQSRNWRQQLHHHSNNNSKNIIITLKMISLVLQAIVQWLTTNDNKMNKVVDPTL